MASACLIWRVQCPVLEHGAGDSEEPVGDAAKGTHVAVTAGAQCGVFRLADGVAVYGNAGPGVDGVLVRVVGREAANHDLGLARAFGDGSDTDP